LCQKYTIYHWFCEGFRRLSNNYEKKIDVGFKYRPVHPNSDMPKLKNMVFVTSYQIDHEFFGFRSSNISEQIFTICAYLVNLQSPVVKR
jgi:hypothetical protein